MGSVILDGRNDSGETLLTEPYVIFLEAINEGSGVVENMKRVPINRDEFHLTKKRNSAGGGQV